MDNIVSVYDKGHLLGKVNMDFGDDTSLIAICSVDFGNGSVEVLFVRDVGFGMVVDKEIADRIREACHE